MHPLMIQEIAKDRQEDILRAARGLGPLPEWYGSADICSEPGRVRQAIARRVLGVALALLGEDDHVRQHLTELRLSERGNATC